MNYSADESFRLIVDTIPGLVAIMTAEGQVEYVNRQVLDYFGRPLDQLKQWGTSDAVHPDDLPRVIAAWRRSIETGVPYEVQHRIRRADGAYRWFQLRGLPLRDAEGCIVRWYILLTDIDERKQMEEKLWRSECGFAGSSKIEPLRQLATQSFVRETDAHSREQCSSAAAVLNGRTPAPSFSMRSARFLLRRNSRC